MDKMREIEGKDIISKENAAQTEPKGMKVVIKESEAAKTSKWDNTRKSMPKDEYVSSETAGRKPTGLYSIEKDKEGKTVIKYDDPHKTKEILENGISVPKLKEKRDSLKMQIRQEADNPVKAKQLKKKLKEIEKQIRQASKERKGGSFV